MGKAPTRSGRRYHSARKRRVARSSRPAPLELRQGSAARDPIDAAELDAARSVSMSVLREASRALGAQPRSRHSTFAWWHRQLGEFGRVVPALQREERQTDAARSRDAATAPTGHPKALARCSTAPGHGAAI